MEKHGDRDLTRITVKNKSITGKTVKQGNDRGTDRGRNKDKDTTPLLAT